MTTSGEIVSRPASIEAIIDLRNEVIIAGTDRDSPYFDGDHAATTRHFGAFLDDRNVGCLSFFLNEWKGEPAWQLRGMATHPGYPGRGVGRCLLRFAEESLRQESKVWLLWCNARTPAVGFYEKQGWRVESEEFVIKGVGPHFRMSKRLE